MLVERACDQRAVARAAERDGVRPAGREVERTADAWWSEHDPASLDQDYVIVALQPGPGFEMPDQRAVQGKGGDDHPSNATGSDHRDLARGGHRIPLADAKATGGLDGQARPAAEHPPNGGSVATEERALESWITG